MIDNRDHAVLVTGGAGFVGSYVVRDLLAMQERVVVYDAAPAANVLGLLLPSGRSGAHDALTVVRGAVIDQWRLLRLCEQHAVDRIVHLASPLTQDVTEDPPSGIRDICQGTATVLEVARARGIRRVVWASSVAVFGTGDQYPDGPIANAAPHLPDTLYGSAKSLCERMALLYRERFGVDSIGLRLTIVYGAGRLRGFMSFPSELIRRAAAREPVEVPIADVAINWQYVEDVASLVVHALQAPTPRDVVFNTSGDVRTFRDAAGVLAELAPGTELSFRTDPRDDGERSLFEVPAAFDDGDLRTQIGWSPSFDLPAGVRRTFESFAGAASGTPV